MPVVGYLRGRRKERLHFQSIATESQGALNWRAPFFHSTWQMLDRNLQRLEPDISLVSYILTDHVAIQFDFNAHRFWFWFCFSDEEPKPVALW